jgi:hypothetical protein
VVIRPNPSSGITEHTGYEWMDLQSAKNAGWCPYLKNSVDWALFYIKNYLEQQ